MSFHDVELQVVDHVKKADGSIIVTKILTDELIAIPDTFPHETDRVGQDRFTYTASTSSSVEHYTFNSEVINEDATAPVAEGEETDQDWNALSAENTSKIVFDRVEHPFISRHLLYPPPEIQILHQEFVQGDLNDDIQYLKNKTAAPVEGRSVGLFSKIALLLGDSYEDKYINNAEISPAAAEEQLAALRGLSLTQPVGGPSEGLDQPTQGGDSLNDLQLSHISSPIERSASPAPSGTLDNDDEPTPLSHVTIDTAAPRPRFLLHENLDIPDIANFRHDEARITRVRAMSRHGSNALEALKQLQEDRARLSAEGHVIRGRSNTAIAGPFPLMNESFEYDKHNPQHKMYLDYILNPYRSLLRQGKKLNQWLATSLCANDVLSSVLYVVGPCIIHAGIYAPFAILSIVFLLYLFRSVYSNVVLAIPFNGGGYNALLNTSSKALSTIAANLTIISYICTAVVSATEAVHYVRSVVDFSEWILTVSVISLLFAFAVLSFIGIGESAAVAVIISFAHLTTLTMLLGGSIWAIIKEAPNFDIFWQNVAYQSKVAPSLAAAIYYGFAAASLGVSGFETSANFISEQRPGVFVQTLRNMWALSSFFNFSICTACLFLVPVQQIVEQDLSSTLLSVMAERTLGRWFAYLLCGDAFLVLSGAVLTSYAGIGGLTVRLTLDRCLPNFLLQVNSLRGTYHWIIFGFFGLCSSMYLLLNGDVSTLEKTYSIAFLLVMMLFAYSLMNIKIFRPTLFSPVQASWFSVCVGMAGVAIALSGVIASDSSALIPFGIYFGLTCLCVETMLFRNQILSALHYILSGFSCAPCQPGGSIVKKFETVEAAISDIPMAFFTHTADTASINRAVQYIIANEDCSWIRVIHCFQTPKSIPATLDRDIRVLNEMYPNVKIDLVLVHGDFSPAIVAYTSVKLGIPRNLMFITTPGRQFRYQLGDFGGVRVITQ